MAQAVRAGHCESGFDHYWRTPEENRRPHWLFDPPFYEQQFPDFTLRRLATHGLANSADHYLRHGDIDGRTGSHFFSPSFYCGALSAPDARAAESHGAFRHHLRSRRHAVPDAQVSPYFDPA